MPSSYCVTFRIADKNINGKSYDDRRQSIIDAVRVQGLGFWEETTSFFLMESNLDTNTFAKQASAGLSANDDMLVAFDPSDMSAAYFGAMAHPAVLASFFKTAKKLP
jgi:hypothetical protein